MPNYGLQEFSVQEATNVNCFTDWNYEILDLSVDETDDTQYQKIFQRHSGNCCSICLMQIVSFNILIKIQ